MNNHEDLQQRTGMTAVMFTVQVSFILFLLYELLIMRSALPDGYVYYIIMDVLCMVILTLISLSLIRSRRQDHLMSVFLWIIFFDVIHLFSDGLITITEGDQAYRIWIVIASTMYLICPLLMMVLYWRMLDFWMNKSYGHYGWADIIIISIAAVGILLAIGNTIFGYYSAVSDDGEYYRGELYALTIIIPVIMVVFCVGRITNYTISVFDKLILLTYPLLPVIAAVIQHVSGHSIHLTVATFLSIVLVYTNFYSIRESELVEIENQLTTSKLHSLQMQINPHMLFNTMSSIAGMCDIDPGKAQDMIFKLSDYLRDNFTDIDKPIMVSLSEELEQLDHYIEIETMRFPNITVVKDIGPCDFMLPRMSLQPLVENAIKHGICKRRKATGTLKIRSYETEDAWIVSIEDDGVGFDGWIPALDIAEHRGIYNVRTRLSILCNGTLKITGKSGEGAVSMIIIPKNNEWG